MTVCHFILILEEDSNIPKVTEEYLESRRNFILDCAAMDGILNDSAINSMNGRDIDILGLCETLAKSLIYFLNLKE